MSHNRHPLSSYQIIETASIRSVVTTLLMDVLDERHESSATAYGVVMLRRVRPPASISKTIMRRRAAPNSLVRDGTTVFHLDYQDCKVVSIINRNCHALALSVTMLAVVCVVLLSTAVLYVYRMMAGRHTSPLPPGPKPLPLVGNLFHLPAHRHCEEFTKWRLLYGDMVYMNIVGRKYIVLNSAGAAIELYDKRGSIYNTRPQTVMAADLVGRRNSFTLIPYGERYRTYKKYMHNALNHRAIADYWDSIDLESITFLQALSTTPEVFRSHVRRNIGAVALRIAYGYQVEDENDHFVALADELARITRDSLEPGRWLVDSLHWLRHIPSWMPGAQFKQWAQQACLKCEEFTDAPFAMVKRNVAKGHAIPSFTSKAMEGLPGKASDSSNAEAQDIIKHVAASIYAGGTDTTASLMTTFFLVMACYPEIQKKAQAEIDAVIGPTRLPSPSDEEYLPYVGYLIKELHRINPIVPLIPRTTLTDDVYRGFHIPKNSYIIANAWAITRDPEIYPQPEHFDPERFATAAG